MAFYSTNILKIGTWVDCEAAQVKIDERMKVGEGRGVPIEACRFFFFSAAFLGLPRRVVHLLELPEQFNYFLYSFLLIFLFPGVERPSLLKQCPFASGISVYRLGLIALLSPMPHNQPRQKQRREFAPPPMMDGQLLQQELRLWITFSQAMRVFQWESLY